MPLSAQNNVLPFVLVDTRPKPVESEPDFGPTTLNDIVLEWHAAREVGCVKGEQLALKKGDDFRIARYGR